MIFSSKILSKKEKRIGSLLSLGFIIIWIILLLQMIGVLPYGAFLYTVDEKGSIYIVEEVNSVRIIPTEGETSTFRLYSTSQFASVKAENNTIEFTYSDGGKYITDLKGMKIGGDYSEGNEFISRQKLKDPVLSPNGAVYQYHSVLGFYWIEEIRNDAQPIVRYRMPTVTVVSRIMHYFVFCYLLFWATFIPLYFICNNRIKNGRIVPSSDCQDCRGCQGNCQGDGSADNGVSRGRLA